MAVSLTKLLVVALMGAIALLLATIMMILQALVLQKQQLGIEWEKSTHVNNAPQPDENGPSTPTVAHSLLDDQAKLYLWKQHRYKNTYTTKSRVSAEDYWNPVKDYLSDWDATLQPKKRSHRRSTTNRHIASALEKSAMMGHADAHHYYAVALASGIWPTTTATTATTNVKDDLWKIDSDTTAAYLHWHMAAIDGNIEASQALAYRVEYFKGCEAALPYKQAAAHGIIDRLEADPHSRAKVTPPMDNHALPEIYTHGGTSSQLAWDNKPNESPEAIQYYHIRATAQVPDVQAAYTLGHMYHYGMRGVEMNLTKALFYYDIAANLGHWEAAGQAGKFHVWSLGMRPSERKLLRANRYFNIGAPYGLEGCRTRYRHSLKKKSKRSNGEESASTVCDHPSLNGLGLLHLFGVRMVIDADVELAKQYFILARDMGNMDASYNLAMLRLGWTTAWKNATYDSTGTSIAQSVPEFMDATPASPNAADYLFALQELTNAANKGHLQARHRLAMMYHDGVTLRGQSKPTIQQDCSKAMVHYQWILDHASISWSQRTRLAYQQYMQGNLEGSLRNYLMAAETGHAISQVNAAFLFERGTCLGLSPDNCRKASLRYWKAAAQQGHAEAAIRVGDFYYFGSSETLPFRWLRPILFPEKALLPFFIEMLDSANQWIRTHLLGHAPKAMECAADESNNGQCLVTDRSDLSKAAHYYRLAVEQHKSPRAHFNLGFMHEWGLGLKQDFPLAKRHYDFALASAMNHGEADFAVPLALFCMRVHEMYDKAILWWQGKVGEPKAPLTEPTNVDGVMRDAEL